MGLISYARNLEDVMLWRALRQVEKGCYIDLCARDHAIDSVSLAFYEKGWRGINITSNAEAAVTLSNARPGESALPWSDKITLPGLQAMLGREVHWLRMAGNCPLPEDWGSSRPWIVLIENPDDKTAGQIQSNGYVLAYSDGINRFYLSDEHQKLAPFFSSPPNALDDFTLSGTASHAFCRLLNSRIEELEKQVETLQGTSKKYADMAERLSNRLLERNKKWAARLMKEMPKENNALSYPEAAHLNSRAQRIYAELRLSLGSKVK